jgi:hypothetical protein
MGPPTEPTRLEGGGKMITAMTTMKKWQDEYLTRMASVEEPVVKVTGEAVKAVAQYIPARPHWAFLDQVPTMTEFVENQLKFRQRVVDEQTVFVRKLMKALSQAKASPAPKARTSQKASPVRRIRAKAA